MFHIIWVEIQFVVKNATQNLSKKVKGVKMKNKLDLKELEKEINQFAKILFEDEDETPF